MTGLRKLLSLLVKGRPNGLRRRVLRAVLGRGAREEAAPTTAGAPGSAEARADLGPRLASVDEVPEGGVIEVMLDGEPVAVCRIDGAFYAVDGTCPHAGGPLGDGELDGKQLTCPYHGWSFDVETGICAMDDSLTVRRLDVTVVDGEVRVSNR